MGDIADAMIYGDMDCVTGEWLGDGAGYPRTTEPNHPNSINGRNGTTYKYSHKVNGVKKFMKMHRDMDGTEMHEFCNKYIHEKYPNLFDDNGESWETIAEVIQNDFGHFAKYVKGETTFVKQ